MSIQAKSSFKVTRWEDAPYDEPKNRATLSRATIEKKFTGDLNASSTAEALMCVVDKADFSAGAGYIASERIEGELLGRKGSFVLQHGGLSGGGLPEQTYGHIVPGSGTDELDGIGGTALISRDAEGGHWITIDFDLD